MFKNGKYFLYYLNNQFSQDFHFYFLGETKVSNFSFYLFHFFSPEKVLTFCTHLYSQKNKDFFFCLKHISLWLKNLDI